MPQRDAAPSHGVCALCWQYVGAENLKWDHCHECGEDQGYRGHLCNECNLGLRRDLIRNWDAATHYLATHRCAPRLMDVPCVTRLQKERPGVTYRARIGNGPNDHRYVMASTDPRFVTVEQMAALWGVSAGTARDKFFSRTGTGKPRTQTLLVSVEEALIKIKERWNL